MFITIVISKAGKLAMRAYNVDHSFDAETPTQPTLLVFNEGTVLAVWVKDGSWHITCIRNGQAKFSVIAGFTLGKEPQMFATSVRLEGPALAYMAISTRLLEFTTEETIFGNRPLTKGMRWEAEVHDRPAESPAVAVARQGLDLREEMIAATDGVGELSAVVEKLTAYRNFVLNNFLTLARALAGRSYDR